MSKRRRKKSFRDSSRVKWRDEQEFIDGEMNPTYDPTIDEPDGYTADSRWEEQVDRVMRNASGTRKKACKFVMNQAAKLLSPKSKSGAKAQKIAMKAYQRAFVGNCSRGAQLLTLAKRNFHS